MSYDSPTPLAILRHVDISNESYVNSADVLCKNLPSLPFLMRGGIKKR